MWGFFGSWDHDVFVISAMARQNCTQNKKLDWKSDEQLVTTLIFLNTIRIKAQVESFKGLFLFYDGVVILMLMETRRRRGNKLCMFR